MQKSKRRRKDPILQALGHAIRERRLELGLSQEMLGQTAELHRTYITDVEGGARNISFLTLLKLAEALKCSLTYLMIKIEEATK
ncbi:MAG: helix-turn-helix transcriptional regulator [Candidatus Obscuribacterales bacterium]|nr:helix-turn-helix transcriptional regulator [Candidatus Obscuribacterales bacterium]